MEHQQNKRQPKLHVGQLIKDELVRQERTVSWFARKLCCDRSNVYKIFKRSAVDTDLLLRISTILQYNFFDIFTQEASGIIDHTSMDNAATSNDKD